MISTGGIDVNSIVSQLMNVERQPLQKITQRETGITLKIDAMARVQGALSGLQGAVTRLASASLYSGLRASSSTDAVAATVTDSTTAAKGTYAVKVTALAASHAIASTPFANSDEVLGAGTLTLQVGDTSTDIAISDANNTLAGVRDAINAAKAGVSAAIVTDGNQVRLTLSGTDTGAAKAIKITVVEQGTAPADAANTDATGLSALTFDGAIALGIGEETTDGRQMIQTRAAADADYTLNGLELTSSSNTITGAIPGVTLSLRTASADTISNITVAGDTSAARAAINEFVKAYNEFDKVAREVTSYNPTTRTAAVLNGDTTVRNAQYAVRALVRSTVGEVGGGFSSLSEIGVSIGKDNTLAVDSAKLEAALANPDALSRLMTQDSTTLSSQGLASRLKALTDGALESSGSLPSRIKGLQSQINALDGEKDRINRKLEATEERLRRQYAVLDAQLQRAQNTSQSLENALRSLPQINSSDR